MTPALLRCLGPRPGARIRLLCLPYAGGGAATYRRWPERLPETEVWVPALPGHPGRLGEPAPADLRSLASDLAAAVSALPALPLAVFGHSMGAVLGLETARALQAAGRPAKALFASGRGAPASRSSAPRIGALDDAAFIEALRERYGGLPPEIAANAEIMELMLPVLRGDIRLLEEHDPAGAPLSCPIYVFGGRADASTPPETLEAWREATTGPVQVRLFAGAHFYLEEDVSAVTAAISAALASLS